MPNLCKARSNKSSCDDDDESRNKPVDQKRPDERLCAPGNPAERKAAEDGGKSLHFRFADEVARRQGQAIASWIFSHIMRPIGGAKD